MHKLTCPLSSCPSILRYGHPSRLAEDWPSGAPRHVLKPCLWKNRFEPDLWEHVLRRGLIGRPFAGYMAFRFRSSVSRQKLPRRVMHSLKIRAAALSKPLLSFVPRSTWWTCVRLGVDRFEGRSFSKQKMIAEATASCGRILTAAKASGKRVCYAENWVYAPAIQTNFSPRRTPAGSPGERRLSSRAAAEGTAVTLHPPSTLNVNPRRPPLKRKQR